MNKSTINPITIRDIESWLMKINGIDYKGAIAIDMLEENDLQLLVKFLDLIPEDGNSIDGEIELGRLLFSGSAFPEISHEDVYDEIRWAMHIYGRYARCKLRAIKFRKAGSIYKAQLFEKWCEEDYLRLPKFARW